MTTASTRAPADPLFHLLHRAGQCADELFAAAIGDSGLTPRQFAVLLAAASLEEPSQSSLVERTGIDRSTIADIVRRLVERGLIERRRTRHDARMYAIRVTDAGEAAIKAARPAAEATDARLTSMLSGDQRAALMAALRLIVDTLGPINSAGGSGKSETGDDKPAIRLVSAVG